MKLLAKFTLWYLSITAVVLLTGGLMVFYTVKREIDKEAIRRLTSATDFAAEALRQGKSPVEISSDQLSITMLDTQEPDRPIQISDTMAVFKPREAHDRKMTVGKSYRVHDQHYFIAASDFVAEPDEIADGVIESLAWTFVALLLIVAATSVLISRKILSPFHKTLQAIHAFSLKQQQPVNLPSTGTSEFVELNHFVQKMTDKAREDYRALKEFAENASHELQTPLAVIRGKLELLLESPITQEQGELILAAHNSVERLSRINQSLTLLNKLENREFDNLTPINLSIHMHSAINELIELIDLKSLSVKTEIQEGVKVKLHPALLDIMLMNLLSNAIRHNNTHGSISIKLSATRLTIQNTGPAPAMPTAQLFQRFKKSNTNQDSIGLGLAIVKQICDVSGMDVSYLYANNLHTLEITWPAEKRGS